MLRSGSFARTVKIHKLSGATIWKQYVFIYQIKFSNSRLFSWRESFRSNFFWLNFFLGAFFRVQFYQGFFFWGIFSAEFFPSAVNLGLTVIDKSFFPTSFVGDRFQGNLFSFGKHKLFQKIFIWHHMFEDTS